MQALILSYLIALHASPYDAGESHEERVARMSVVAEAIARVANGDRLKASFLLVQGRNESAFRLDVQNCKCPVGQCDYGRSHSFWQLKRVPSLPVSVWWGYCGTTFAAVYRAASRAVWLYDPSHLERSFARCGGIATRVDDDWVLARTAEARRLARRL